MKKILILCVLLTGCGSSNQSQTKTGTELTGTWNVIVNQQGVQPVNLTAYVLGSQCQVSESGNTFTVQGPSCVLADNVSGVGHVSSTNSTLVPEGVLIGSAADPASDGSPVNFLYAAEDASSNLYVFSGTGSVTSNTMSGSWSCYTGLTICSGWTGTFTATRQ